MKKIIEVDFDDPKDLKKVISGLQIRRKDLLRKLGFNEIRFNGSKYNIDNILPEFNRMLDSVNIESGDNYVYFHCNPYRKLDVSGNVKHLFLASRFNNITHEPIYVGKGIGDRYLDLNRNDSHRKIRSIIRRKGQDLIPVKIIENISERTALELENVFMYSLGLKALSQYGLLCNLIENDNSSIKYLIQDNEVMTKILKKNGFSHF
jgi:hypothetical protein